MGESVATIDLVTNADLQTPLKAVGDFSCPSIGRYYLQFHAEGTNSVDETTA